MEEITKLKRQKRGQVTEKEVKQYENAPVEELKKLLNSNDSKNRTIAAVLIGDKKIFEMIPQLCKSLAIEKSLYSRIAMSEALGKIGEPAVIPLISLLGRIGNNQERKLPGKYCEKKSYPLAKDMAARTLVKIGKPAIPGLLGKIKSGDSFETQQAIDAIGGIVSKIHEKKPLLILLDVFVNYSNNEVTTWKIIRALSAFKYIEVVEPLLKILENNINPPIRWETIRSIGQVGISNPEVIQVLQNSLQDQNSEVRKAAKISLEQIKEVKNY